MTTLDERPPIDLPAEALAGYAERVVEITEPGIYDYLSMEQYHLDPVPGGSLSSSGARKLLDPGCPALFHYERQHPTPPTDAMEFGTALHTVVLGTGTPIDVVDAKSWQGKAAQAERAEIRAAGRVPLLPHDFQMVHAMAAKLRRHPLAAALFNPERGMPERSLFWRDQETGVMCRARPDWLPEPVEGERLLVPDLKSTGTVDEESLARTIATFSYYQQADFYENGIRALGIADDVAFLLVFISRKPPHLIRIVGVPDIEQMIAAARNKRAIELFAKCTKSGEWPDFGTDITEINTPGWAQSRDASEYL